MSEKQQTTSAGPDFVTKIPQDQSWAAWDARAAWDGVE